MYNKKRAQSEIITTVLIILLVLAAIVIVWQVVRSTVTTGASQITGGTDCITLGFQITRADIGSNNITIKRIAGVGDLDKIKLILNGVTNSTDNNAASLSELESKQLFLSPLASTLKAGDEIEIAAVLGIKGNGKVCNIADTYIVL
jgi:flagellin-like protein